MIPQYTEQQFMSAKSRELLPLLCAICNTIFYRTKHQIQMALNENHHTT